MKKTQASMQAKIDKLNGNLAEGLDVHIDRTVKKAAMERLRQWAAGKNTTLPLVPDNSSSIVDPAQIIAEEKKENVERRCRRDEQAGLKMIQKAKDRLASED